MDMDVEAKRIMALSITKLYSSRTQRGGLRLHRSLLLSMVMRSARDIYHSARLQSEEQTVPCVQELATEEPMDTSKDQGEVIDTTPTTASDIPTVECGDKEVEEDDKENNCLEKSDRQSRKRRGKTAVEPDFLPLKKARMETEEEKHVTQGAVLRTNNGNSCRPVDTLTPLPINCAVGAC
ncbi:immediate early response 2b [Chanos chanos]|uniref:Immediate early response 2b n=1 Tax=Chanos chanos TaxID=29144 RepID=A0A6J2W118_CHACN|nr:immediate early response gene 2 protein [Chanos chanos]